MKTTTAIKKLNKSLSQYSRFQIAVDSLGIWFSVQEMIGGFDTLEQAYSWATRKESALAFGFDKG